MFGAASLLGSPALANPTAPLSNPAQASADYETALGAFDAANYSRALSLAKSSASAGSSDAAVLAGYILREGLVGAPDLVAARRHYEYGAQRGHPDALVALGEMGLAGEAGLTDRDAFAYLTRASDAGRTDATRALAEMARTGRGTEASVDKQRDMLARASDSFDRDATKRLADTYFETDPQKALQLYEDAAGAGHVEAAYIAGVMYAENLSIRPDEERSAYWLGVAAQAGHAAAQADYGLLVYQGAGVPRDDTQAADWFRRSAEGGDSEGMFLYAFTLAKGEGVEQDFGEAYYWLLKAGDSGVDDYQSDRDELRKRLEENVDPAVLEAARARL